MTPLPFIAPISIAGPDALGYLQGQLSNDLETLTPEQSLLASCNSAQGRVQAVLQLLQRSDAIVALLPTTMVDIALARLRKYVLRAKVVVHDARNALQPCWATASDLTEQGLAVPQGIGGHYQLGDISVMRWRDAHQERFLVLRPGAERPATDNAVEQCWQLADIRAGLPQVFPETHESFVAQMLNLDVLGGISFDKGCYTGQEIIARAHFRGTVKRRMFRLQAACPAPPPGARTVYRDEPAGEVVSAANTEGGCELLAVLSLAQHSAPLRLSTGEALQLMSLPYEVPTAA